MPEDLFSNPKDIDYKNALEVSIPLMYASRLIDEQKYEEALTEMEALYAHKDEIMPLYVKEIACELVFLYLRTGHIEEAKRLLNKDLRKYIETYRKMMSSKERILIAIAFYLDNDEAKAQSLYQQFKSRQDSYLLQGEFLSDLSLIEDFIIINSTTSQPHNLSTSFLDLLK